MSYLPVKFVLFLKSRLIFKIFYCFCMFVNKHFANLRVYSSRILKNKNTKFSGYYFCMDKNILRDFEICISLPLMFCFRIWYWNTFQYKYIIQITAVKQSDARVASKDICLFFIILFLCLFSFCLGFLFIS